MHLEVTYFWKEFNELSLDDLYAILNLRQKVFVLEQDCPYIDADYSDQDAFHLLGYKDNDLIAYLRAFKPGIKYEGSSLGRIVTEINSRGLGLFCSFDLPSPDERDQLVQETYKNNLIILGCGVKSIRFRPHLTVTKSEIDFAIDVLKKSINNILK